MTLRVKGMLSYKWFSADLKVDQPCVHISI